MWNALRATLIALGASAAGTVLVLVLGAWIIAYYATHPPRRRIRRTPQTEFGATFENVVFPASDGVRLHGWYVPARPDQTPRGAIVLCHGAWANRAEVLPWAALLWEHGFSLLLFDFRRLGQSEGELCTSGYQERDDLRGAVDYLCSRPETAHLPIGAFGFSMGGATAILTAADDERIQAVATHGAFATLQRAILQRCRRHFGPLATPAAWLLLRFGNWRRWFPASTACVAPINAASRLTPRPLLLIHGSRDRTIHPADARDLAEAAGAHASLHVLPRSGHRTIHPHFRDEVRERVVQFFCEALVPNEEEATRPMLVETAASKRVLLNTTE